MHTALWVFIAGAIGLMLFATLQEDLPSELSFLKLPDAAVVASTGLAPGESPLEQMNYQGWAVQRQGATLSITRPFMGVLTVNEQQFDTPQLGILCHNGALSVRLDTRLPTTGRADTPVTVAGQEQAWAKGASAMNVLAAQPAQVLKTLLSAKAPVTFTVSYRDLGVQPSNVNPVGLEQLVAQMAPGCFTK